MASSGEYYAWMKQCEAEMNTCDADIQKLEAEVATLEEYMDVVRQAQQKAYDFFDARDVHSKQMYEIASDNRCVLASSFHARGGTFIHSSTVSTAIDSLEEDKWNIRQAAAARDCKIDELKAKRASLQQHYNSLQASYNHAVWLESLPPPPPPPTPGRNGR